MANPNPLTHRAHRGLLGVVKPRFACFGSSCLVFACGMLCVTTTFADENSSSSQASSSPADATGPQNLAPKSDSTQAVKTSGKYQSYEDNQRSQRATQLEQQLKGEGEQLAADRYADAASRWKRVAAALEKATQIAKEAARLEQSTTQLQDQTRRARTLVEQTEARRARALGELRRMGIEAVPTSTTDK